MWVKILTHTLTHTPKCAESAGEFQTGISGAFLIIVWSGLHYLCHEAAHLRCGIILHLSGGVGIGSEGESGIVVAQHGGHSFDIHTVLECQGGEGVAEIMKSYVWQISILQYLLVDVYHTVRVIHFSCDGRGKHIGVICVSAMLLDEEIHRILGMDSRSSSPRRNRYAGFRRGSHVSSFPRPKAGKCGEIPCPGGGHSAPNRPTQRHTGAYALGIV